MRLNIDQTETAAIYGLSDAEPALEIYPDVTYDTDDGRTVPAGNVLLGDFRWRVVGSVQDGAIIFPGFVGVYSTEDSRTNQLATCSAYIRIKNLPPIPWLLNFRIPPLTANQKSQSWDRLRVHNDGAIARSPGHGWQAFVTAMIDAALANLQTSGTAILTDGEVEIANTAVTMASRIMALSMDENVTGVLSVAQQNIIEHDSFVIRSTNPGDNGLVAWIMIQ